MGKPHKYLDQEALRVVLSMPKWKPGTKNGQPAPMEYSMPVQFHLMEQE